MARVTVDDSLEKVNSRFELVELTIARVQQIKNGQSLMLLVDPETGADPDESSEDAAGNYRKDKVVVQALREIAKGLVPAHIVETSELAMREAEFKRKVRAHDEVFTKSFQERL